MPAALDPAVKARALALYEQGVPVKAAAALAGCSRASVSCWAKQAGVAMRGSPAMAALDRSMHGPHDAHLRTAIVAAYLAREKLDDIAAFYGESVRQVLYIVRRAGVPAWPKGAPIPVEQRARFDKLRKILGTAAARAALGLAPAPSPPGKPA